MPSVLLLSLASSGGGAGGGAAGGGGGGRRAKSSSVGSRSHGTSNMARFANAKRGRGIIVNCFSHVPKRMNF